LLDLCCQYFDASKFHADLMDSPWAIGPFSAAGTLVGAVVFVVVVVVAAAAAVVGVVVGAAAAAAAVVAPGFVSGFQLQCKQTVSFRLWLIGSLTVHIRTV
jgi:hypothetical protein